MSILLTVSALLAGVAGGCYLNQATLGVGLIGGACFLAILARIAQADNQHQDRFSIDKHERKATL